MNKIDLAYIAGFFDGEGSIVIIKSKSGNFSPEYAYGVSIGQKDGQTLDWIKEKFGGNVYLVKHDGSFYWALGYTKAIVFLKMIQPYLKYKKPQADLAIEFYESIQKFKLKNVHKRLSEVEISRREEIWKKMRQLKKEFTKSNYYKQCSQVQRLSESIPEGNAIV